MKKLERKGGSFFDTLEEANHYLDAAMQDIFGMYVYQGYLGKDLIGKMEEHMAQIVKDMTKRSDV